MWPNVLFWISLIYWIELHLNLLWQYAQYDIYFLQHDRQLCSLLWRRKVCSLSHWQPIQDQDQVSDCRRPDFSIIASIWMASSEDSPPSCWNTLLNASRTLAGISLALLQRKQTAHFKNLQTIWLLLITRIQVNSNVQSDDTKWSESRRAQAKYL